MFIDNEYITQDETFEPYPRERKNHNNKSFGVHLHFKVEGKVPLPPPFIAREMGEITCLIDEQRGRGQEAHITWLVLADYLFFIIVKVLDR